MSPFKSQSAWNRIFTPGGCNLLLGFVELSMQERVAKARLPTQGLKLGPFSLEVLVDGDLVRKVERDRAVHLFQREGGERLRNRLWRLPAQEGVDDGVERDSRMGKIISAMTLLDVCRQILHSSLSASMLTQACAARYQ